jgi:hypothetical protein
MNLRKTLATKQIAIFRISMSEELIDAIRQRIAAGQTKEEIIQAVLAMGHTTEVTQAAYTLATHDVATGKESPLRFSARTLFKDGWQFVTQHPRLTLVSAVPLVVEVGLTAARNSELGTNSTYAIALTALSAVAALIYIGLVMVILLRVTKPDIPLSYTTAFTFIKTHILSLCVIYLFSGLIILGGLSLFLIPGLAVMISITFAQYVYIHEGKRGLPALLQSAVLVRGRFSHLFQKIIAFFVLSFALMLGLVIVFSIIEPVLPVVNEALLQIVAATITVINLHAMNSMYVRLNASPLSLPGMLYPKLRYLFMMVAGVVVIIAISLAYAFYENIDSFFEELPAIETASGVQAEVTATALLADTYRADNNLSYTGVCESLKASVTKSSDVQCNDSGETWALTATDADGVIWCADKSTPAKQIQVPLDTRTECFGW